MKIAAEGAARYAVGPLGLAALAVSATLALRPTHHEAPPPEPVGAMINGLIDVSDVRIGEIVVVGSPDAATIASRIRALDFSQCRWSGHIALYVHIRDGVVAEDSTCLMAVVARQMYVGDADVMIPLDFVE